METNLVLPGVSRDSRWERSSCSVLLRRAKRTTIPEGERRHEMGAERGKHRKVTGRRAKRQADGRAAAAQEGGGLGSGAAVWACVTLWWDKVRLLSASTDQSASPCSG
jgi:hypothetical protein